MAPDPLPRRHWLLVALVAVGLAILAGTGWLALRDQPLRLPAWLGGEPAVVAGPIPARTPIPGGDLPLGAPCFGERALAQGDYLNAYRAFMYRQGDPRAAFYVGVMHRDGRGVLRNPRLAIESFLRAANNGQRDALTALGWMFRWDRETGTNFVEARRWFERAALQGDRVAAYYLADMYRRGNGGPADLVRAHAWLSLLGDEPVTSDGDIVPPKGPLPVADARHDLYRELTRDQAAQSARLATELRKQIAVPPAADGQAIGERPTCVR